MAVSKSAENGGMATFANPPVSSRQYLKMLEESEDRLEYWDGEVVAMAGGSYAHNLISANIIGNLWQQFRGKGCKALGSDALIRRKDAEKYVFADVVVQCEGARVEEGPIGCLNDPVVVFEVLSPATEQQDRKRKFAYYTTFESLKELVLVNQNTRLIEHHYRESIAEEWRVRHLIDDDEVLELSSVGARVRLGDVYEGLA